jgi:hypothetical protein
MARRFTVSGSEDVERAIRRGVHVEPENGSTVLSGVCVDASALYGVLDRVRELGLDLLDVESFPVAPECALP